MVPDLDAIWREYAGSAAARRPDFRFDPDFYAARYGDAARLTDPAERAAHFAGTGRAEGRHATLYQATKAEAEDLDAAVAFLAREPRIKLAIDARQPDAAELLFELMALGDPLDKTVADFSVLHYRTISPDLHGSDLNLFLHYVKFGYHEGRPVLAVLRRNVRQGGRAFDPARRTVIVATHEFSATGAPIVALDLAVRAADTFNVVVLGLRLKSGELIERFVDTSVMTVISENPDRELQYLEPGTPLDTAAFAVLNSIECFPFIKVLVARQIPFASYVHEFTEYSLPAYKSVITTLYAERVLFSSETVQKSWTGVLADAAFDVERDSAIIPQAALIQGAVPADDYHAARATLSRLIGREVGDARVVYGAGHVHWRKGTDIFVMAAKQGRRTNPDTIFVWIGDGLDHEDFHIGVWVEKHLQDARVNTPDGNLFYLPAGPYYADVCRAADILFLTSRLDPLPNVVFDAAKYGCATVLFEGASGFDDERYRAVPTLWRVPFGDLAAAAETIAAIPAKSEMDGAFAVRPAGEGAVAEAAPPSEPLPVFDQILAGLEPRPAAPVPEGDYDVGILFGPGDAPERRARERRTLWRHGRRAIWPSREAAERAIEASDNWVHRTLRIAPYRDAPPERLPAYSIHVHAHYTDGFAADLTRYAAYRHAARVLATTDTEAKADTLAEAGEAAGIPIEVRLVPNRGRDILPFLSLFTGEEDENALWCHVHQKKSLGLGPTSPGEVWRTFLMTILLGGPERISSALAMVRQPHVGLAGAFDPYIVGWTGSRRLLAPLQARLDRPLPEHPLLFPIGNMFWAKAGVVNAMRRLFGDDYPWPNEPIAGDGTVFHLIERLWPMAAALSGRDSVFLDKADARRV